MKSPKAKPSVTIAHETSSMVPANRAGKTPAADSPLITEKV